MFELNLGLDGTVTHVCMHTSNGLYTSLIINTPQESSSKVVKITVLQNQNLCGICSWEL